MSNAQKRPGEPSECRSCKAKIVWTMTTRDKRMPCDFDPVDDGTFYLFRQPDKILAVNHKMKGPLAEKARGRSQKLYASHFSTCPNANDHRR